MFTQKELENREKSFIYSKERFEKMKNFLNGTIDYFKEEKMQYSATFMTIARFISYKEDIWKKNKITKHISTNFSKEILDDFVFKGKFTTTKIAFDETRKRKSLSFEPINISKILTEKENDSAWIIDNIRDSITHGHYYIDFDTNEIIIKNKHDDRILECSIKFETLRILTELITEERIGGYTDKKLTTTPILHLTLNPDETKPYKINNENELRYMFKNLFILSYCQVEECWEVDNNKKYDDLAKFYNFNTQIREEFFRKPQGFYQVKQIYTERISSYIEHNMKNYKVNIFNKHLDDDEIERLVKIVREKENFYTLELEFQGMILAEIAHKILSHKQITLEQGIVSFTSLYNLKALENTMTDKKDLILLKKHLFTEISVFTEIKKLANLFILAINNFVSNKEAIYDKYFDEYDSFDLSDFEYKDYSGYSKLIGKLKNLNIDLNNANNAVKKANDKLAALKTHLAKAPQDKKGIISNNITNTKTTIEQLENTINNLVKQINTISTEISNAKNDENGKYIDFSNKNFFNHLRNALAHSHIRYADDRLVYNRKIVLEDFDDNGNLSFRCQCRYYDLVKLFNNDLFLESLHQTKKTLTKKI